MLASNIERNADRSNGRSQLAQNIDALIAAGFRNDLRPVAPPDVPIQFTDGEKTSDGKIVAKFDRRWFGWPAWQKQRDVTDADVAAWRVWPDAGLCLVLGDVIAIDIDIKIPSTDPSFAAKRARALVGKIRELVAAELGSRADELPARTRPGTSSTVIFMRAKTEFFKPKISFGEGYAIEFLTRGKQVVVAGRHKSGDLQHTNLAKHGLAGLQTVTEEAFDLIRQRIRDEIEAAGYSITQTAKQRLRGECRRPRTDRDGVVWAEVMRRRAEWMPSLLPVNEERLIGECHIPSVALDRDLEDNLVIYPDGISDFGTERGHTPLSLIREFGAINADGSVEFGGCPVYGQRDGRPYSVIGESDPNVRRPSETEALAWLCRELGGGAPVADTSMDGLARALGLDAQAIVNETAAAWFKDEDNVVPIAVPEQWQAAHIRANRSRLPVLRAIDPTGFEKLKEAWDAGFAMMPAEVDALIAEEIERVRRRASPPELPPVKAPSCGETDWPEPADIFGDAGTIGLGDFPLECLKPQLAAWVRSHARRKGVPTAFAGAAALTTISAAVGASLKIRPKQKDDWEEPSGLWLALIAEPGSGKSPTISAALAPLRDLDNRHGNEDRAAHAEWTRRHNKRRRKDEPDHPIEREPRIRRYVLDSVTIEKMVRIMANNPRGIMRAPDEWASFLGEMGAYKKDAGGDRAMALRTFDGGSIDIERMGSGNTHAACGLQSILAGSQPDKIERALSNLTEDGMAQRTLFVLDDGVRRASIDEEPDASAERAYRTTIQALVTAIYIFDDPVRLTPKGYEACERTLEQISLIGRYPGTPAALVGHLAKWGRLLPRIILAMHSFEECQAHGRVDGSKAVPTERVERCIRIALFLVRHQVEFYRRYLVPDERDADARWLAGFMLTKPDLGRFSHRTIYDARTELRGTEERDRRRRAAIMAKLVDAGWCGVDTMKNGVADTWLINPRVHQRFADRAKLESAQRAARLIEIEQSAKARRMVLGSDRMS